MKKPIYLFLVIFLVVQCKLSNAQDIKGNYKDALINLTKIGKIMAKQSKNIKGSYWGIQAGSSADSILKKASQLGVKWTRLEANWEDIEKKKGEYNWNKTDKAFSKVLKYGITPFVTLGRGNRLYSGTGNYDDPKLAALYGKSPAPPVGSDTEMDAWLRFVGKVINRYKGKIKYWEIWNEPNHRKYWGAPPSGKDYGRLVKLTAKKIRSIQPDAKIIAGSMAGIDAKFADHFLSNSDPENIDIISFHNYSTLPEDRVYLMPEFLKVINNYNSQLEIWQGECGIPSQSRTTGYRGRAPWGLNIQAKWLLRQSFVDTYFCRATLSNYFKLAGDGSMKPAMRKEKLTGVDSLFGYPERGGSRVYSNGINQKNILFRNNQQPKPAYYAYQNLCSVMDDSYKVYKTDYKIKVIDQGSFYGIGEYADAFPSVPLLTSYRTNRSKSLIAYWLPWNPQETISKLSKVNITINDTQFKNPVLVDLLNSTVYMIDDYKEVDGNAVFGGLPMGDYPMAIVNRESVELTNASYSLAN